ncbi:MAG TPA: hypothetical protein H9970_00450, partial [Candidatus Merdibacter merdipullorum]|nr:hypothetical protein [Candidatus Merdibacter merdipullorum]
MARKSYNFYRNELSLITLAVLIGFYAFTAFDICVNHYANSVLSHDEGPADMALWTRYMEDYNEDHRRGRPCPLPGGCAHPRRKLR